MRAGNNFIYLGKIVKAHGTKGDVVIALEETDLATPDLETLFVKNFAGDYLPYKVEHALLREKSSRHSFFVKFVRIDSRTESEGIVGSEVYIFDDAVVQPEKVKETEPASLIGCKVFDEQGNDMGKVLDEMHTQAHPLIEIQYGDDILMLPLVDEYIVEYNSEEGKVIVKNLDRFID